MNTFFTIGLGRAECRPFEVDLGADDAPAGDVRESAMPRHSSFDVFQFGSEPPRAVTDLADVVHAAVVAMPRARMLALIPGIAPSTTDDGEVGERRAE